MDHISNIQRPLYEHIKVPYLFRESYGYSYDNAGFFIDFPTRQGWDSNLFLKRDFSLNGVQAPDKVASFLQAWLYFGFIAEVLQTKVNTREFVEEQDDQVFVTAKPLQKHVDEWQDKIDILSNDDKEARFRDTSALFREAWLYFRACTHDPQGEPPSPLAPEVQLSLVILYDTLYFAMIHIFRKGNHSFPFNLDESVLGLTSEFVENRLQEQGWCPSDIALLEDGAFGEASNLELYYASLLGTRHTIKDHSKCARFVCTAFNVDAAHYQVKHASVCNGDCGVIQVNQEWLVQVTNRKRIPLIEISTDEGGSVQIDQREGDFNTKYVAISHVYADGLGNPHGCGLPTCQLKQLQKYVNSLDPQGPASGSNFHNTPFWMDTLCIPVRDDLKNSRKMAIWYMADVYETAQKVLVLNAELEHSSCHASPEELLMRITNNSWFRRLWTLQEGVLACKIYFQFGDGAVEVKSLQPQTELKRFSISRKIQIQALKPYLRIRSFRDMPREQRIRELYAIAQWRATSKDEDEPYCLATLLQLRAETLQQILGTNDAAKRWEKLILGQEMFPVQALFFLESRLSTRDPPIGWSLRRFLLRQQPERIDSESPLAKVDESGWHVCLHGITFPQFGFGDKPANIQGKFSLPDFKFADENGDTKFNITSCYWLRDPNPPGSWNDIGPLFGATKLGIILETWPLNYKNEHVFDGKMRQLAQDGISPLEGIMETAALIEDALLIADASAKQTVIDLFLESNALFGESSVRQKKYLPGRGAIIAITSETEDGIAGYFCGTVVVSKTIEATQVNPYAISPQLIPTSANFSENSFHFTKDVSFKEKVVQGHFFGEPQRWCIR